MIGHQNSRHFLNSKTNRDSLARVFPRLAPVTCICLEFWLVHCIVYVTVIGRSNYLGFWFYDTELKTALLSFVLSNHLLKLEAKDPRNYQNK